MAKVAEFPATVISNGSAATVFYDDASGLSGGWGVNDGVADVYRPLGEIVRLVKLQDHSAFVGWIEGKLVKKYRDPATATPPVSSVSGVREAMNAINVWFEQLRVASSVPPEPPAAAESPTQLRTDQQ